MSHGVVEITCICIFNVKKKNLTVNPRLYIFSALFTN